MHAIVIVVLLLLALLLCRCDIKHAVPHVERSSALHQAPTEEGAAPCASSRS